MLRRDFVRAVVTAGLAPKALMAQQAGQVQLPLPAPVPWPSGLNPQTPIPHTQVAEGIAESQPAFFNSTQMATLNRLTDVLMPPLGKKPGALEAGTPVFLDFFVGKSNATIRKMYASGLDWLNGEALRQFKLPFAKVDNAKADAILKPWLRTWLSDHPPTEAHADFINIVHHDIRNATVNSKAWNNVPSVGAQPRTEADLYWLPIEPDLNADRSQAAHVLANAAVSKAGNKMPEYSR